MTKPRAMLMLAPSLGGVCHAKVIDAPYRHIRSDLNVTHDTMTTKAFFACISLAGLLGCASTPMPTNIVDTAGRTPQLSTLSQLINDAGLADTLRGSGPFTVFAPTNEAFKAVPASTMASLAADKNLLRSVLTYHVLPGKLMAADAKVSNQKTVQGATLAVANAGSTLTVEDAIVVQGDVPATNGVVHVIDRVLMPPAK